MAGINYSKWDHIEVSDDEDETHPNVDTPSLFKWRHEARLERKKKEEEEKAARDAEKKLRDAAIAKLKDAKKKIETAAEEDEAAAALAKGVEQELTTLQKQQDDFLKKEAELERYQREHPHWDVDNIGHESQSKTVINAGPKKNPAEDVDMTTFFKKYGEEIEKFAMLSDPDESMRFLRDHIHLISEHLGSYLVIWCVDLCVEEKKDLMKRAAHQSVVVQFIFELAKSMKKDPRDCVAPFFVRMKTAEKQYKDAFNDELKSFIARVENRAKERLKEAEEKARKKRLGPTGLDPHEVLESLPQDIREAFENQDTPKLQAGFARLTPEEFKHHYTRVVESGLWVPEGGAQKGGAAGEAISEEEEEEEEEEDA